MTKGTAILFKDDLTVAFFENLDAATFKELQKEKNKIYHCQKSADSLPTVSSFWLDEEIDWEYGY
ncbi:MAG: hypothetical protein ABF649_08395 [Bacillus sp. (in: firmicutes)]